MLVNQMEKHMVYSVVRHASEIVAHKMGFVSDSAHDAKSKDPKVAALTSLLGSAGTASAAAAMWTPASTWFTSFMVAPWPGSSPMR